METSNVLEPGSEPLINSMCRGFLSLGYALFAILVFLMAADLGTWYYFLSVMFVFHTLVFSSPGMYSKLNSGIRVAALVVGIVMTLGGGLLLALQLVGGSPLVLEFLG